MTSQFKVLVTDDVGYDKTYTFSYGRVSVGRSDANDIRMSERNVSRQHAAFEFESDGAWVEDLGSYNGLFINGERKSDRVELRSGDVVTVGDFSIEVQADVLPAPPREETTNPGMMLAGEPTNPGFTLDGDDPIVTMESGQFRAMTEDMDSSEVAAESSSPRIEKTAIIRMDADISDLKSTNIDTFDEVAGYLMGTGDWRGQEFQVKTSELVIGRAEDSDIVLNHRSVSARHAMLMTRHGRSRLLDLGSSNGTLVNGETYADVELQSGDKLQLGHTTFVYTTTFDHERIRNELDVNAHVPTEGGADGNEHPTTASRSPAFKPLWLVALVAVVAFGGWFLMNPASEQSDGAPEVVSKTLIGGSGKLDARKAEAIVGEARAAITQRRWSIALSALAGVDGQAEEPHASMMTELRAKALLNQAAETNLSSAQQAAAQGAWDEAFNALSAIDPQSVYHEEASGLKVRAQGALVDERVERIRQAIASGKFNSSLEDDLNELEGLSPEKFSELSRELNAARERAAKRNAEPQKARPAPKAAARAAPRPTPKPATKPAPRQPKAETAQPAKKSGPPAKAIGYQNTGTNAYNSGDYEGALAAFKLCLKLAPTYGNCLLGIGVAYEKLQNFAKAKENFVKFLKYAPGHKHTELVKRKLQRIESR